MTTMVTPPARHRVAKSLESESASIVVILGGFAVVAASILGADLLRESPTADAARAAGAVQVVDVAHRSTTAAGPSPIAETEVARGAERDYRDGVLYYAKDTGAVAMREAIAAGMPPATEIRVTADAPAAPPQPKRSQWWWMPAGFATVGAVAAVARLALRRRPAPVPSAAPPIPARHS